MSRLHADKTLYDVLGIDETATQKEIKAAYRKRAVKLHPDVNKADDAKQQFMEAKTAYETLSDSRQRASYDRTRKGGAGGNNKASDFGADFAEFGRYARCARPFVATLVGCTMNKNRKICYINFINSCSDLGPLMCPAVPCEATCNFCCFRKDSKGSLCFAIRAHLLPPLCRKAKETGKHRKYTYDDLVKDLNAQTRAAATR
jgi:curved DNA-binding protein CbpA